MPVSHFKNAHILFSNNEQSLLEAQTLLATIGFADWKKARQIFQRLGTTAETQSALLEILPAVLIDLQNSAHPDQALLNLEHFVEKQKRPVDLYATFAQEPRSLEMLLQLFAGSQFLSEVLMSSPDFFNNFKNPQKLVQPKSHAQLDEEIWTMLDNCTNYTACLDALRRFKKLELLRIGACDLFGLLELETILSQLSLLANRITSASLTLASQELQISAEGFCVLALGKLGGRELNYSSDIDLIFLSQKNTKAFQRLGQKLIEILTQATNEGFLYRVDMRLRPWGRVGALVPGVEEALDYFDKSARIWEKQAWLKGRRIAGDESVGSTFFKHVRPQIFQLPASDVSNEIQKMKKEIESNLTAKGQKWGEVKGGKGSIRDVEFLTQYLQITNGSAHPEIWSRNTLDGLARLALGKFITVADYHTLTEGYRFLRSAEHYLQIMHNQQVHKLPEDERELHFLAIRLGFEGKNAGKAFVDRYHEHSKAIHALYKNIFSAQKSEGKTEQEKQSSGTEDETVLQHVKRLSDAYKKTFSSEEITEHARLLEKVHHDNPCEISAERLDQKRWRITVAGYDFPGELSLICGLLFVYGLDIEDGAIFTYEPVQENDTNNSTRKAWRRRRFHPHKTTSTSSRRKILDVFTVRCINGDVSEATWPNYHRDLNNFLRELQRGMQSRMQGELAKQVARVLKNITSTSTTLLPVEIAIDNSSAENYTVLRIDAPDTLGFLYEFTNALALNGVYISRVNVTSLRGRAHDTVFICDAEGNKIVDKRKQNQLRAATVLVKHFTHLLPQSPNPESAMLHFREFLSQLFTMDDWPFELATLERPEVLHALANLLGVSEFLWEDFLRMQHQNLFPVLTDVEGLGKRIPREKLEKDLQFALLTRQDFEDKKKGLNEFKDREMFRIDMRYIQNLIPEFRQFSQELVELGEVVLNAAYHICYDQLFQQFGLPLHADGKPCKLSICALGKFGGGEIGFGSDIELIFVYSEEGKTNGERAITNAEFYDKLVIEMSHAIVTKREGIFEIDLRLRPYGKAGSHAVPLSVFQNYFSPEGAAWNYERQALVKMRHIIGDATFGEQVITTRDACVYTSEPFDTPNMRAMRERQIRQLVAGGTLNAKFSSGALVDIEFLVQGLQITHGANNPALRISNTEDAMHALHEYDILQRNDYEHLAAAHIFMRRIIEALRMVRGNAKDLNVPAVDSEQFAFLARRMGYSTSEQLQQDILSHTGFVREAFKRLLH
ncbi:MAG: glutamine synthetase adenylyltransferase [Deferribacteres bacterium]|nr:glutamine synthetase adenylyltransferase [candidate division KSB1 bacterium]MCB9502545.1 glutamine synthetase adenylyltransferase [Deferribacteres bacterium]